MQDITLSAFMERPYVVEVEKRGETYFLLIPDLSLAVSTEDVAKGHAMLDQAKRDLFEKYHAVGRVEVLPLPRRQREQMAAKRELTPFFIKAATVALVGGLLVAAANISIIYTLQTAPRNLALYANRTFVRNFTSELEKLHAEGMTPERQAKIKEAIRKAVPILRPYAVELRPLFQEALGPSG